MSEQQDALDQLADETAADSEGYAGELVTIAIFPDPGQANLARASLDASGIPSFVQGENANSLLPVAFLARLQVRPGDEATARAILEIPSEQSDVDTAERLTETASS